MRRVLVAICYFAGIIFYVVFGLVAILAIVPIPEIITIVLGVEPEYESWELLFGIRWALIFGGVAFVLYWIGRFLTGETLGLIWWKFKRRTRRQAR